MVELLVTVFLETSELHAHFRERHFQDKVECQTFVESDEFGKSIQKLMAMIGPEKIVRYVPECVEIESGTKI